MKVERTFLVLSLDRESRRPSRRASRTWPSGTQDMRADEHGILVHRRTRMQDQFASWGTGNW